MVIKTDLSGIRGKWNVIMYHHSFEHIPDPHENLLHVYRLLADTGICILRIPTVSSLAWEEHKEHWYQLDAPRHFFLHSIESIRYLAEKCGLELVQIIYDSRHKQFTNSEKYRLGKSLIDKKEKGIAAFIRRKIKGYRYDRKARLLNKAGQGDQAAFILRKRGVA